MHATALVCMAPSPTAQEHFRQQHPPFVMGLMLNLFPVADVLEVLGPLCTATLSERLHPCVLLQGLL